MHWYSTPEANALLNATSAGRFAFLWKVTLDDGTVVTQFPAEVFDRYLTEPIAIVDENRTSVDRLDVRKVKELVLIPSAIGRTLAPWLSPVRLVVDLEAGEKFISFWSVDREMISGFEIARHVVGISKPLNGNQAKFFVVVSPSGNITVATKEDLSFEGE
jgi:hypothetical protein